MEVKGAGWQLVIFRKNNYTKDSLWDGDDKQRFLPKLLEGRDVVRSLADWF